MAEGDTIATRLGLRTTIGSLVRFRRISKTQRLWSCQIKPQVWIMNMMTQVVPFVLEQRRLNHS